MNTPSEELAIRISKQLAAECLIDERNIDKVAKRVGTGQATAEEWKQWLDPELIRGGKKDERANHEA